MAFNFNKVINSVHSLCIWPWEAFPSTPHTAPFQPSILTFTHPQGQNSLLLHRETEVTGQATWLPDLPSFQTYLCSSHHCLFPAGKGGRGGPPLPKDSPAIFSPDIPLISPATRSISFRIFHLNLHPLALCFRFLSYSTSQAHLAPTILFNF